MDLATPAAYTAAPGANVAITLNWYRVPMAANYLQFMHLVGSAGQTWSVDDHWTTSATWAAGAFAQTRAIALPQGLAAGTYDIRVGLSGGNPWADLALLMGSGVTDPGNDRRYKVGTLTVSSGTANVAPQITSAPETTARVGVAYSYRVTATDANGGTLTFSLPTRPSGMTINATTGQIAWTPTAAQVGNRAVTARVVDPGGLATTQSFTVNVVAATTNVAPQ
ncbi:MAG: putative Ig domain-containing protein, partial [Aquabacterium sp.]